MNESGDSEEEKKTNGRPLEHPLTLVHGLFFDSIFYLFAAQSCAFDRLKGKRRV